MWSSLPPPCGFSGWNSGLPRWPQIGPAGPISQALSILCLKSHIRFLHTFFDKEEIVSTPCEIDELNSLSVPNDEGNEVEIKLALSEIIEVDSSCPFLLTD